MGLQRAITLERYFREVVRCLDADIFPGRPDQVDCVDTDQTDLLRLVVFAVNAVGERSFSQKPSLSFLARHN